MYNIGSDTNPHTLEGLRFEAHMLHRLWCMEMRNTRRVAYLVFAEEMDVPDAADAEPGGRPRRRPPLPIGLLRQHQLQ